MDFPLFLIPILIGFITQFSKRFLNERWLSHTTVAGIHMPRYGGMPSAHSAFVFSLATVVGMTEGIFSPLFAVAIALVILVLDDALRMRIFLGRQGQAIHALLRKLPEKERRGFPHLETRLGHTAKEVVVGAVIGISLTYLLLLAV